MRRLSLSLFTAMALAVGVLTALPAEAATLSAKSLLSKLSVRAESGSTTYSRGKFSEWMDADGDGCDTREEVLLAESRLVPTRGNGCEISAGRWYSPYDAQTWTNPSDVDIDHVIPFKEAWESGARAWSADARKRFSNDLAFAWSLDAMTDNLNASKQDRDPAGWMPPKAKCEYVTHWVAVKYRWRLSIDTKEKVKAASILTGSCGARSLAVPPRASLATPAKQVGEQLEAKVSSMTVTIIFTAATDPNELLGRPGGYTAKIGFDDSRVSAEDREGWDLGDIERGGSIEVFATPELAKARSAYIQGLLGDLQFLGAEYHYLSGGILLRITGTLTATEAQVYKSGLSQISSATTTSTAPIPPAATGIDPRFSWCYEANAAGYGPYYRGVDPEYDWYTDRDNDGVVCET